MTTTDTTTAPTTTRRTGTPTWVDLSTHDLQGATTFYADLFGWTFEDRGEEFGHYHYILRDGEPVGGAMSSVGQTCPDGGAIPTEWGVYLSVPDMDAALTAVPAAGGRVAVPAMPVGDSGTMAVAIDPSGAVIGLWQPGTFAGFATSTAPGSPVWFEEMTQAIDEAIPFYRSVFDWEIHEMPGDWRYVTNGPGESATAGLCDAKGVVADGTGSYWRTYFTTDDLDAALTRIPQLGGKVLDGPEDSPYGRVATVADPQGAHFQLMQPPSV